MPAGPVVVGGGGLGLLVLLAGLFLFFIVPRLLGSVVQGAEPSAPAQRPAQRPAQLPAEAGPGSAVEQQCLVGADANERQDCRIVAIVNSIQEFWKNEAARKGVRYQPAQTQLFTGMASSGCGFASAAAGPFYCPNDRYVFVDLEFFEQLQTRFGARGGPFAEAYVLAHEYGHHIQNLSGILDRLDRRYTGPDSDAVRSELMADCLAGSGQPTPSRLASSSG